MPIALYGGSFDPPHVGHGMVCYYLLEALAVDEVWLIPTFQHAFQKNLAPFDDRLQMCNALAQPFKPRVRVLDIERRRGDVSYTIDTVRLLQQLYPGSDFWWVVGSDILPDTVHWREFEELKQLVHFCVLNRPGFAGGSGVEMPDISSTDIRARVHNRQILDGLLPKSVQEIIYHKGLYV